MKTQGNSTRPRPRQLSSATRSQPATRNAFTLVELLVVITIIGILVALLIPAVSGVMRNAKNARISLEINGLMTAMEAYKQDNLTYPPDFALDGAQDGTQIVTHLARKFRYRDKKNDVIPPAKLTALDPAEALVFWLSGLSSDPKLPLINRENIDLNGTGGVPLKGAKPYFDFDQARLQDRDGDDWPEYYPEGSEVPYVYFWSQNYGVKDPSTGVFAAAQHAFLNGAKGARPYAAELEGAFIKRFVDEEKFQIICAGQDNEYGAGTELAAGNAPTYPDGVGYREADDDNLTSFSEGRTLRAAIP